MTLDIQQQMLIEQRIGNDAKSPLIAYLLLIFFGGLGAHRFYLGRAGSGTVMLAMTVLGVLGLVVAVGAILLAAVAVWMLIDLFLIPGMASRYKDDLRDSLRRDAELAMLSQRPQPLAS